MKLTTPLHISLLYFLFSFKGYSLVGACHSSSFSSVLIILLKGYSLVRTWHPGSANLILFGRCPRPEETKMRLYSSQGIAFGWYYLGAFFSSLFFSSLS